MPSLPFVLAAPVTLNGGGNGNVAVGPITPGERWELTLVTVQVNGGVVTNVPQCNIYIGPNTSPEFLVDGTYNGALNSSDNVAGHTVSRGEKVTAVWAGADANAKAVLIVRGNRITGAN